MYKIGLFSKINKITVKTLRYYDEMGLLKPAYVDPETGYRYYTSDQLPDIHRIRVLRSIGFSIDEILLILKDKHNQNSDKSISRLEKIFENRRHELEQTITVSNVQLLQINHYLKDMKEDIVMKNEVLIKELPEVIVFSKRTVISTYDDYFQLAPAIGAEIAEANPGLTCAEPEYCFVIYHDGEYKEKDIDIEFCEAVTQWGKDTDTIKFKKINRVPEAACIYHKGAYKSISEAYGAVFKWIEKNGYIPCDNPRESYIDGIWNKEKEEDWLTEIQVPVTKR